MVEFILPAHVELTPPAQIWQKRRLSGKIPLLQFCSVPPTQIWQVSESHSAAVELSNWPKHPRTTCPSAIVESKQLELLNQLFRAWNYRRQPLRSMIGSWWVLCMHCWSPLSQGKYILDVRPRMYNEGKNLEQGVIKKSIQQNDKKASLSVQFRFYSFR